MAKLEQPHNIEAELALLAALLQDPSAIARISPLLQPDDFYTATHGWAYAALLALHKRGQRVDPILLCDELQRERRMDERATFDLIHCLLSTPAHAAHAEPCARIVHFTAMRRRAIHQLSPAATLLYDETITYPEAIQAVAADFNALAADTAPPGWDWSPLAQACEPRPPRTYLVHGLLPLPGLFSFFGAPGTLKTMLLIDLALCVVSGQPWLKPQPDNPVAGSYLCEKSPVLWIDVDNGRDRLEHRLAALARGHDVPPDAPLHYVSFPEPRFAANDPASIHDLLAAARRHAARLIVIDNLGTVSGGADENSAQMIDVMAGLRTVAEKGDLAVIVIHHKSKGVNLDFLSFILRLF